MKVITIFILALVFLMIGLFTYLSLNRFLVSQTQAQEYSPLDFISDYDKFEVIVGVDKTNGRYCTYHYEFNE
jgi:uncharacterized SAM-binding protein YcdF (DUF218 family)